MKEVNNAKIIIISVIFCVILCGVWGVNKYINYLNYTIQQLKNTNLQLEAREQKFIGDMQSAKETNRQLDNRNKQLERNNNETINTVNRLQQTNRISEKRITELTADNKQLSITVTELSTRLNKTSANFDDFRKGLERQSRYIEELSKTIAEIETGNNMEKQ